MFQCLLGLGVYLTLFSFACLSRALQTFAPGNRRPDTVDRCYEVNLREKFGVITLYS